MARKKRRGGRRGLLSRVGRKAGSLVGTFVQLLGVGHGLVTVVARGGDFSNAPRNILFEYTGISNDGSWNQQQAIKSATIIGVAWGVGYLIKQVARRM